ncbi:alpha/beta hydrolase [Nesterenkonia sp. CL21]|uniref:alpha/beta fold hydrolase n=1 Tax=Nesterenkonia sp. CL21 TaxID=3064894 RepID=UPI00287B1F95|nr:alpha/beta hydrolase [Nesterenkonia sp. CL21]MDS2173691.1 alpha/beta hydrolase [Nesterenkonia sp. CL21]
MRVETSAGDPVVLLPGMNCSSRMWSPVIDGLEARGYSREIRCETLAGSSLEACAEELLERLPDRFALAGLSLGGIVAMALVRAAPSRVSRLCLMATNPRGPRTDQLEAWGSLRERLRAGETARQIQLELLPVLLAADRREALDDLVLQMADDVGECALEEQLRMQSTRIDERAALAQIDIPTTILAGGRDLLCPVTTHQEMASLVSGSQLIVLPHRGHLLTLEDPQSVASALDTWLRT